MAWALFGKSLSWQQTDGHQGLCIGRVLQPGSLLCPPGPLTRPLTPWRTVLDLKAGDAGWGAGMAAPGAQPRAGEGFPGFCLYMAEERRQGSARGIVLRGCLASGSDSWILVKPCLGHCLTALTMCWSLQGCTPTPGGGKHVTGQLPAWQLWQPGPSWPEHWATLLRRRQQARSGCAGQPGSTAPSGPVS